MHTYKTILNVFDINTLQMWLNVLNGFKLNIQCFSDLSDGVGETPQNQQFNIMYIIGQKWLSKLKGLNSLWIGH